MVEALSKVIAYFILIVINIWVYPIYWLSIFVRLLSEAMEKVCRYILQRVKLSNVGSDKNAANNANSGNLF